MQKENRDHCLLRQKTLSAAERLWPHARPSDSAAVGHNRISGLNSGFAGPHR